MNLLDYLTPQEAQKCQKIELQKDEVLANEGDFCTSLYIITKGKVKIVSYSIHGNELIYNIVKKDECFGNNLIFSDNSAFKGDVVATENTTILYIKRNDVLSILHTNQAFLLEFLRLESNNTKKLNSTIKLLSFDTVEERLDYYFFINNNRIEYKTITDLASTLHVKRETLSRYISTQEKRHLVRRLNKVIIKL